MNGHSSLEIKLNFWKFAQIAFCMSEFYRGIQKRFLMNYLMVSWNLGLPDSNSDVFIFNGEECFFKDMATLNEMLAETFEM